MWEGEIRVELSEELTCVRCELLGEKRVSRRGGFIGGRSWDFVWVCGHGSECVCAF